MRRGFWVRFRVSRLIVISIAMVVYIALAFFNIKQTFSHLAVLHSTAIPTWLSFALCRSYLSCCWLPNMVLLSRTSGIFSALYVFVYYYDRS